MTTHPMKSGKNRLRQFTTRKMLLTRTEEKDTVGGKNGPPNLSRSKRNTIN